MKAKNDDGEDKKRNVSEAKKLLDNSTQRHRTARQTMLMYKGAHGSGEELVFPTPRN